MKQISNELYKKLTIEEMEKINGGGRLLNWLNQLSDTIELGMSYYTPKRGK